MSDLTLIRSLLAVSRSGAIGEAAEILGLSQSALSRRIRQLEEEMEAELVVRSGRGIVLTELGRMVVGEGKILVERFELLKEDVKRHARLEAGVVRVGGGATAVSFLLPRAIFQFQRAHPDVRFEVREAGSRDVEQAVRDETLEIGLVTLPLRSPDLDVSPLLMDRIVLVAGSGHPFACKKRVSVAQLQGQSLVGFEAGSAIRDLIDAALREADVARNVVMELRSIAAILQMVETTSSLAFVSDMGAGQARVLPVGGLKLERQLALITKRGRALSPAAASFADEVVRVSKPRSNPKNRPRV